MKEQLAKIRAEALAAFEQAKAGADLDSLRVQYLGKKGELTAVLKQMGKLSEEELEITTEENQLVIRGRQVDGGERDYLYRGIAARQFQRTFVLADGMRVQGAELKNGLLAVDLDRPEPVRMVKKINISVSD